MNGLSISLDIFTGIFGIFLVYQLLLALFSIKKPRRLPEGDKIHRFALVVSARNEEAVIGNLIDSLNQQQYPREAFDVFVIADNCTDATGEVARSLGARVFVRQDRRHIGKGYALNWFFDRFLAEHGEAYDAIGVFDADNLVDDGFLAEMNRHLCAGEVAVMGYRDSKNPQDSWVAAACSISFWLTSRFYNVARSRLGLSVMASGTGFVFKLETVMNGWHTKTISEDSEFSLQLIARGFRVGYTPYAVFYDEQPLTLAQSMRQRRRWAVGSYQNLRFSTPLLLRSLSWRTLPIVFDSLIWMLFMPLAGLSLPVGIIQSTLTFIAWPVWLWDGLAAGQLQSTALSLVMMSLPALLTVLVERKFSWKILKGVWTFPLFLITNNLLYLLALVTPNISWHPIEHKRAVSLSQIERG